jgi:hypothetical protein
MSELQGTQASNSKAEERERERAEAAAAKEVAIRASYDELKMAQALCEQAAQELERAKSDGKAIAGEAAKRAWKEAQVQMEQVLLIDCTYQEQTYLPYAIPLSRLLQAAVRSKELVA